MTRQEQLKHHTEKLAEIKQRLDKTQDEWLAYNKVFNAWVQAEIGVSEIKGELHLTDILTKWDLTKSDKTQEANH